MPLIAAGVAAGGSLLGGALGAQGARDAAQAQMRMFREGQNQNQANYLTSLGLSEPWRYAGNQALNQLMGYFGMGSMPYQSGIGMAQGNLANAASANNRLGADAVLKLLKQGKSISDIAQMGVLKTKSGITNRLSKHGVTAAQIQQLQQGPMFAGQGQMGMQPGPSQAPGQFPPGYEFFRNEGQRNLLGSFGAGGQGAFSGNALKALSSFNQNYAGEKIIDPLMRMAGFGQGAAGMQQQASQSYNNAQQYGMANMADARASGIGGAANMWGQGIMGAANAFGQYAGQPSQYDQYLAAGQQGWGRD
jgi:hypothetical protein